MLSLLLKTMVVLMNLDESGVEDPPDKPSRLRNPSQHAGDAVEQESAGSESDEQSWTQNLTTFSAALSCYP